MRADRDEQLTNDQVDRNLINLVLSGDGRAFEALVRRYQKLVYNFIFQMVRSRERAADLTQETFLKTYRHLNRFKKELRFKPWLMRIASNTALNSLRDERDHLSLDEMMDAEIPFDPADPVNVEQQVEYQLAAQELEAALAILTASQRSIFVLRYQHDFSYEDIATISNESVSAIKSSLFRSREKLRKHLFGQAKSVSEQTNERGTES